MANPSSLFNPTIFFLILREVRSLLFPCRRAPDPLLSSHAPNCRQRLTHLCSLAPQTLESALVISILLSFTTQLVSSTPAGAPIALSRQSSRASDVGAPSDDLSAAQPSRDFDETRALLGVTEERQGRGKRDMLGKDELKLKKQMDLQVSPFPPRFLPSSCFRTDCTCAFLPDLDRSPLWFLAFASHRRCLHLYRAFRPRPSFAAGCWAYHRSFLPPVSTSFTRRSLRPLAWPKRCGRESSPSSQQPSSSSRASRSSSSTDRASSGGSSSHRRSPRSTTDARAGRRASGPSGRSPSLPSFERVSRESSLSLVCVLPFFSLLLPCTQSTDFQSSLLLLPLP